MTIPKKEVKSTDGAIETKTKLNSNNQNECTAVLPAKRVASTRLEPEKFNSESGEDALKWLKRYNLFAMHSGWSEVETVEILEYYLEGKARLWFECNEEKFKSWKELKEMFANKFAGKQQEYSAWNSLQVLKQEPGEDIDMLSYRLEKLAKYAKIKDEQLKIKYLWNAITPEKRKMLIKGGVETYESAIDILREVEDVDKLSGVINEVPKLSCKGEVQINKDDINSKSEMEVLIGKFDDLSINVMEYIRSTVNNNQFTRNRNDHSYSNYAQRNENNRYDSRANVKKGYIKPNTSPYENKVDVNTRSNTVQQSQPDISQHTDHKAVNCLEVERCVDINSYDSDQLVFGNTTNDYQAADYFTEELNEVYMAEKRKNMGAGFKQAGEQSAVKKIHLNNNLGQEVSPEKQPENDTVIPDVYMQSQETRETTDKSNNSIKKTRSVVNNPEIKRYSLFEDLSRVKANISIPQLIDIAPTVQSQLIKLYKDTTTIRPVNSLYNDKLTNCRTFVEILGKKCLTIIDTGAACSVISKMLVDKLGIQADQRSVESIVTADGKKHISLGKISELPITISQQIFSTELIIMNIPTELMILGIDWMRKYKANVNVENQKLSITNQFTTVQISFSTNEINKAQIQTYSKDNDVEIFGIGKEVDEKAHSTTLEPTIKVLIEEYKDIFADEYTQLTSTNVIEHGIDTGEASPIKIRPYRIPNVMKDLVRKELKIMKEKGIIEPCFSDCLLKKHKIKLNTGKCNFGQTRLNYLGHIISSRGIETDPKKVIAIEKIPTPKSIKELQSFLGTTNYYRKFIQGYAQIAGPLNSLLKKDNIWIWNDDCEAAMKTLKEKLTTAPVLTHPIWDIPFVVTTDASQQGIGGILSQIQNGREHPIAFVSRSLKKAEKNYSITHLEGLAIIYSVNQFRNYIWGRRFKIVTDHSALVRLFDSKEASGRLARWAIILREYDYTLEHRKGKHNPADLISRCIPVNPNDNSTISELTNNGCTQFGQDKSQAYMEGNDDDENTKAIFYMDILQYTAIKNYLANKTYPRNSDELFRNELRKNAIKYELDNDKLFKHSKKFGIREVLHELNCKEKIIELHNENHLGVHNTWNIVKEKYYSPKLFEITKHVVNFCDVCQRYKSSNKRKNLFNPIIALQPFDVIGLDIIGPINPTSAEGNRYIISAIDYLTKWPICKAVPSVQSDTIINFLVYDVISNFGIPRKLITDRGSNFLSEAIVNFYKFMGINHSPTTAYRPQSNGQVERQNQYIKNVLSKICKDDKINWDKLLWKALLVMRTTKNRITKKSPSELLYGIEISTPDSWAYDDTNENIEEAIVERIKFVNSKFKELRDIAIDKITTNKKYVKDRYDRNIRQVEFKVGQYVLKHNDIPDSKFAEKWLGPYIIISRLGQGVYNIRDANNNFDIVNGDRLKEYNTIGIPQIMSSRIRSTISQQHRRSSTMGTIEP
ncbi:Transposon Ty3-I Gag-Pol polyprotein [Zancudomyces culisetae]|uniref:RNA-directed DNA polymerase n=1 Tax=Zancudomyces culisetae TaxID=1213189 RepID=A0A1R1PJG7_ZANCU|nr:Transposon Ty3-I Gag-Pol polyprotein [Zancudomyces culisetae]|eukprot:OMH81098.1 Transposon Ty3-I Gag-Pol polyprotein [Zancudomyces culisetae]